MVTQNYCTQLISRTECINLLNISQQLQRHVKNSHISMILGKKDPVQITRTLIKSAQQALFQIPRNTQITDKLTEQGEVLKVQNSQWLSSRKMKFHSLLRKGVVPIRLFLGGKFFPPLNTLKIRTPELWGTVSTQ